MILIVFEKQTQARVPHSPETKWQVFMQVLKLSKIGYLRKAKKYSTAHGNAANFSQKQCSNVWWPYQVKNYNKKSLQDNNCACNLTTGASLFLHTKIFFFDAEIGEYECPLLSELHSRSIAWIQWFPKKLRQKTFSGKNDTLHYFCLR